MGEVTLYYILFNPNSNTGNNLKVNKKIKKLINKLKKIDSCYVINMFEINQKEDIFLRQCKPEDHVVICGGDGTLDQFINRVSLDSIQCKLFLFPCGSGNDFARDYKKHNNMIQINDILKKLPTVKVNNDEVYKFINGVGMGIDAHVCRSKNQYKFSQVNKSYFVISINSLKTFRPYSLDIEADGTIKHYDNVWFAVCNHGRYMGGGMKVCPTAKREDEYLDVCVAHKYNLFKLVLLFPFIYLGLHVKFKNIDYFKCKKIKFIPDGCNISQRDGEVLDYIRELEVEI